MSAPARSPTEIRAVRDGERCRLVQRLSPTGIPLCVNCFDGHPAPIVWANDVDGQAWVKP
jgi:hypothetical protein